MIYLATYLTYKNKYIHDFYNPVDKSFYSISFIGEHEIFYNINNWDSTGIEDAVEFKYSLPNILNIIDIDMISNRISNLEKIVMEKILDTI